jgi:transcriptional regulator with XRE-family HTH domain
MEKSSEMTAQTVHRLKAARLTAGVSLRAVARRMNVSVATARAEEEGRRELFISDLHRWQTALKVPLAELLEPPAMSLWEPVRQRACMIRLAKTAKTLAKKSSSGPNRRLASRLVNQLEEVMPELKEIGAWPEGSPRPPGEVGRAGDEIMTSQWLLTPPLD